MIEFDSFKKLFGNKFWKSFRHLPIQLPRPSERTDLLREVYSEIQRKVYHPAHPELYISYNKGKGVARTTPAFFIKDYIVYYYCVIRMEYELAQNRVENTYGGWSISGTEYRSIEEKEMKDKIATLLDPSTSMPSWAFSPTAWVNAYWKVSHFSDTFVTNK